MHFPIRTIVLVSIGCLLAALVAFLGFRSLRHLAVPQSNFQFLAQVAPDTVQNSANEINRNTPAGEIGGNSEGQVAGESIENDGMTNEDSTGRANDGMTNEEVGETSSRTSEINRNTSNQVELANRPIPAAVKNCSFATNQFPDYRQVILNEIAWMGTADGATREWLELKNITNATVDISGWQVLDKAEQIHVTIEPGTKISASGFYLLERGEEALPVLKAGAVYTGALANEDEGLRLFDKDCWLRDQAMAMPDWPAGQAETRRTMERSVNLAWHTYLGSGKQGILGTPMEENSAPSPAPAAQNESAAPAPAVNPTAPSSSPPAETAPESTSTQATTTLSNPEPLPIAPTSTLSHIVISEIQITGGAGLTTNDYVEIYNPLAEPFNLKGYRLVKRTKTGSADTSLKSWTSDALIPAGGFYVWANSGYTTILKTVGAATTGSIADDNGVAIRQGSADTGVIIDAVAWGAAANTFIEGSVFLTNPAANEKLKRKHWQDTDNNANDFEISL